MSIFEKIDSERHRKDINLCKPASQPDATGFSVAEPDAIPSPSASFEDALREPTVLVKSVTPIADSVRRLHPDKPAPSNSTDA